MTNENTTSESKRTVVDDILDQYGNKLTKLFIGQKIDGLIRGLDEETLTNLATGDMPVHRLIGVFPEPETESRFYRIFKLYPNLTDVYPEVDVFQLPDNQLERLARGDNPIDVFGKPNGLHLAPPFNPPRMSNSHLTDGSPRNAYASSNGTRRYCHTSE